MFFVVFEASVHLFRGVTEHPKNIVNGIAGTTSFVVFVVERYCICDLLILLEEIENCSLS